MTSVPESCVAVKAPYRISKMRFEQRQDTKLSYLSSILMHITTIITTTTTTKGGIIRTANTTMMSISRTARDNRLLIPKSSMPAPTRKKLRRHRWKRSFTRLPHRITTPKPKRRSRTFWIRFYTFFKATDHKRGIVGFATGYWFQGNIKPWLRGGNKMGIASFKKDLEIWLELSLTCCFFSFEKFPSLLFFRPIWNFPCPPFSTKRAKALE